MKTLVLQSHRQPLPASWLEDCLASVTGWASQLGFDYRFLDDSLFEPIAASLIASYRDRPVILSDLGRLYWLQHFLREGYQRVIWCDADFLIFNPEQFRPVAEVFALGRENWIQLDDTGKLRNYRKVHNAFMLFCDQGKGQDQGRNVFLDFYLESAERLLSINQGLVPPQFIGPKLLTALHNIVHCPVQEDAGMFSPAVMHDMLAGHGKALKLLRSVRNIPLLAANLSASLTAVEGLDEIAMQELIRKLIDERVA